MRPLKPALPLLAVPVAALALSACGADVEIGHDSVLQIDESISADGHTYQLKDLHVDGDTATATTEKGRHMTFAKVDGRWTVTSSRERAAGRPG